MTWFDRCERHQTYRSTSCPDCLGASGTGGEGAHACVHGLSPWWDCDPCRGSASFGEEPMESYFDEHVSPSGETFTTRAERRRFMAKNNLEYHDVSKKRRGRLYIDMGRR